MFWLWLLELSWWPSLELEHTHTQEKCVLLQKYDKLDRQSEIKLFFITDHLLHPLYEREEPRTQ